MLILKGLIAYAIPDIPSWVAKEMAKIEYKRRQIEKESKSIKKEEEDQDTETGTRHPVIANRKHNCKINIVNCFAFFLFRFHSPPP